MTRSLALLGAAALGAALFLAGYAAALLDSKPARTRRDSRPTTAIPGGRASDALPLRWSDTGEAVETYQTFNYPTGTWYTFTGTIQNGKPVTLRSVG